MDRYEIETKVRELISTELGVNEHTLKNNESLTDDLGADSLNLVELVMSLEEEFKLEITDEVWESKKTVQDVINYINYRKGVIPI